MKRIVNYFVFLIIIAFIFIFDVNAECSFEERKELLYKAKNVEIFFEPYIEESLFKFKMYNLSDDLYVSIENDLDDDMKIIYGYDFLNDVYVYDIFDVDNVINYKVNIYSGVSDCYAIKLLSKNIRKGIFNKYANQEICEGIDEYQYCKPILNKKINLSETQIYEKINTYRNTLEQNNVELEKKGLFDFVLEFWYLIIFIIIGLIGIVIKIIINKRSRL